MHHQEHMSAYMHHIHIHGQHTHTCTAKYENGRCVNTCTITNICATSTKKETCEHTCTTYTYMYHQIPPKNKIYLVDLTSELYERPDQNVSIHAPHTHTCTTKYYQKYMHHQIPQKNKICLVGLTSELYERSDQYERSLLNNMFYVLFSEKCSTFQWKAQLMKSAVLFSEKCNAFQWKALKSTMLFSEKRSWWKVQCFSLKSAALFIKILWGFALSPSIGLSYERPIIDIKDVSKLHCIEAKIWLCSDVDYHVSCSVSLLLDLI